MAQTNPLGIGVTPIRAVEWMLRKQEIRYSSELKAFKQIQREAMHWKQENGDVLVDWGDPKNQAAYQACFSVMDTDDWLDIPYKEEKLAAVRAAIKSLKSENYVGVIGYLANELKRFYSYIEDGSISQEAIMSMNAIAGFIDELTKTIEAQKSSDKHVQ